MTALAVGSQTLRAHIDTGGYKSLGITTPALEGLTVRFDGGTESRPDGAGNRFAGRTFMVPRLTLGGHAFTDVPGFERRQAAQGPFGGAPPFDAVVGRDFLRRFAVIVVDFPNRRFELFAEADAAQVCGTPTAELAFDAKGLWVSTVTTDAGPLRLAWDTGAAGASFIQEGLVVSRHLTVTDDAYSTREFTLGAVELGPMELVPLPLEGIAPLDGLIGISVFGSHRVCFDLQGGSVTVGPSAG